MVWCYIKLVFFQHKHNIRLKLFFWLSIEIFNKTKKKNTTPSGQFVDVIKENGNRGKIDASKTRIIHDFAPSWLDACISIKSDDVKPA